MTELDFIESAAEHELRFVSEFDHGCDVERHLSALRELIFIQRGIITADQNWFPYEVVELGAHWPKDGHEREFTICTLLIILNVRSGTDISTNLDDKFRERANDYDRLPRNLRDLILGAYEEAQL